MTFKAYALAMLEKHKGFTVVESLLVIVVLAAIGVGGYIIWRHSHKSSSLSVTTKDSSTAVPKNQSPGLKTYSNSKVSFQYPDSWTASDGSAAGPTVIADAISPFFTNDTATTPDNPGGNKLYFDLELSTDSLSLSPAECKNLSCQVISTDPLNNPQFPGAKLAGFTANDSAIGENLTQFIVADSSTKVGDKSVKALSKGNGIYIGAGLYYNTQDEPTPNESQFAGISNIMTFRSSNQFQDLMKIFNSIKFN